MSTHERRNGWTCVAAIAAALLSSPAAASSVFGPLDNFDVVNDTGRAGLCAGERLLLDGRARRGI